MNFAKDLNKVPHQRLFKLYKPHYYGIQNEALNWISAVLSNRTQTVVLDVDLSGVAPVTSGVPQGTVLGPVLFLVYINDLPEYLKSSKVGLFADDSIIYKGIKSEKDCDSLQDDLDAAAKCMGRRLVDCFPSCQMYSSPTATNKKNTIKHDYILHSHTIEYVSSVKYLGIPLQSDLKWSQHTNIIGNANKSLGILKRNLKTSIMRT